MSNKLLSRQYFRTSSRFFASLANVQAKPFESVPKLSVFGLLRGFMPGGEFYGKELQELHAILRKKYGNIVKFPAYFGRPSITFIYEAEDFEKVYRNEGVWPERIALESLDYYRKNTRPEVYNQGYLGLFSSQGKEWHDMRTIANPIMMQPKTAKLYCTQVDEIAKEFLDIIKNLRDEKNETPADFQNHINTWSLESICAVALERRLHVLGGISQDEKARELIKGIRIFFEKSFEYDGLPSIWKYYQTKGFKEFLENYDRITDVIIHYIEESIKDFEKNPSSNEHEESVLRKLVKINKKAAIVMASDMLLAGVDTTAVAVTNILYSLAKNPDKQQILRDEIMTIMPEKDSKLTPDLLKNLPYLRAVIKETFRTRPVIAGTARKLQTNTILAGYEVPKDTHVVMPSHVEVANPKQYPQPEKFIPERWLRNNTDPECPHAKTANPFTFLPFGFGSRMCIGKRIADLEMEVLIANIVRNYKVEWNYPDLKFKSLFVNIPLSDLKFKLTEL